MIFFLKKSSFNLIYFAIPITQREKSEALKKAEKEYFFPNLDQHPSIRSPVVRTLSITEQQSSQIVNVYQRTLNVQQQQQ